MLLQLMSNQAKKQYNLEKIDATTLLCHIKQKRCSQLPALDTHPPFCSNAFIFPPNDLLHCSYLFGGLEASRVISFNMC